MSQECKHLKTCAITPSAWPPSAPKWKRTASNPRNFSTKTSTSAPPWSREKDAAERVVSELFAFWMVNPTSLPPNYQEQATREPLPRVICDYIAGMTDHFIFDQHEKYCGGM